MQKTASNEAAVFPEIPNIMNEVNVVIAPGQRKIPVLIFFDELREEQSFFLIAFLRVSL